MKRREFMIASAAGLVAPIALQASATRYAPGLVQAELAAGKTLFLDFTASWCSTCAAQARVIDALRADNPAYDEQILFVEIDWDIYGNKALSRALNIPRRSTLVVLKGDQELGRIVSGTRRRAIKALMDIALDAALA